MWFNKFRTVLKRLKFTQTKFEYALFTRIQGNEMTFILAYVDELLITRNSINIITSLKKDLARHFNINDLGILKYFLGLEFTRTKPSLFVSQ